MVTLPGPMPRGQAGSDAGTWPEPARTPLAGRLSADDHASFALWSRCRGWLALEAGSARRLPWIAVAFGSGIALYFAVDREPMVWVVVVAAAGLVGAALAVAAHRFGFALALFASLASGFALASVKATVRAHTVLTEQVFGVELKGYVETREHRERTDRFVLRIVAAEGARTPAGLERVRLSVKKGTAPPVGSFVGLKARLSPPPAPNRPGGYDFGRDMYFAGLGASGFVTGQIRQLRSPESGGWRLGFAALTQGMRDAIDARISAVLSGDTRAIATALLTGRRDAISQPVNDAMFISGLGHVLSISGYHMAVVAGAVFFAVRALLALNRAMAATAPIKKWAAAAALLAAAFYLLLSGAEVATQRSFLMTAVVLIAVMVDRHAVTFRTLAIAALVVLALSPEALVHPSFQMSFAATLGLVGLVQVGMPKVLAGAEHSRTARLALWGGREIAMLTLASLIAGLATMPYAAFHFHRVTPYGILANLSAMPVVSLIVMPAGLLALIAIPFGLDGPLWRVMGLGIEWMVAVSEWVAQLPGAIGRLAAFGIGPLLAASLGMIVIGLLRTPLRWAGAVLVAGAIVWAVQTPQPDILITADGGSVAVRGRDGKLQLMQRVRDRFVATQWLSADADLRSEADPALRDAAACDAAGCVAHLAGGRMIAQSRHPSALQDDCSRAAVVVTLLPTPADCAAQVIDRAFLQENGATALRWDGARFIVTAQRGSHQARPWSPRAETEAVSLQHPTRAAAVAQRRGIDATPDITDLDGSEIGSAREAEPGRAFSDD